MLAERTGSRSACDAGTKVVVIGRANDGAIPGAVAPRRGRIPRGADHAMQLIEALSNLYNNPETDPVGNVIAFVGEKRRRSSTICHKRRLGDVGDPEE